MDLSQLPRDNGFRLRGTQVTRLETFVDAAFAFALTLLVIGGANMPESFAELREALRRTPVFVFCFVLIAMFWASHNRWSRRFGLEDTWSTMLSLALVLVVLIYVYPLRVVTASGLYVVTGGFVPSDLQIDPLRLNFELQTAFIIYGAGFALMSLLLYLLNRHALRRAEALGLDALEKLETRGEMAIQAWLLATAVLSIVISLALLAFAGNQPNPLLAGAPMFVYMVLGVAAPIQGHRIERAKQRLLAQPD
jgi:uncharacterized membrane protein